MLDMTLTGTRSDGTTVRQDMAGGSGPNVLTTFALSGFIDVVKVSGGQWSDPFDQMDDLDIVLAEIPGHVGLNFGFKRRPPEVTQTIIGVGAQRSNVAKISIAFSAAVDIPGLISDGTIDSHVQFHDVAQASPQSWVNESRYAWDAAANTLTIDLTTDGFGGSNASMLPNGRYEVRINTETIVDSAGNQLKDSDGTNDGVLVIDRSSGAAFPNFFRFGGDLDGDADVDLSDLSTLSAYYGSNDLRGDADGDGDTDLNDLSLLSAYYGTTLPAAQGESQVTGSFPTVLPTPVATPAPKTFFREFLATKQDRWFRGKLLSLRSGEIDTSRKWKACIDWGDGTTSTAKLIYNSKTKRWEIVGDHKYRTQGRYTISIALK